MNSYLVTRKRLSSGKFHSSIEVSRWEIPDEYTGAVIDFLHGLGVSPFEVKRTEHRHFPHLTRFNP